MKQPLLLWQRSPISTFPYQIEVSVIDHDNTLIAELSNPALTTIGVVASDMGQRLIASVLSVLQGGPVLETVMPAAKVFVRASAK